MTEWASSSPVCSVSVSTSPLASPERRRIVRVIARSLRPIDRERFRTLNLRSPTSPASLRPSRASTCTPQLAKPASVGYFTSPAITVESIRTARGRNLRSRTAASIIARQISVTVSGPILTTSFRTVDSSGTRSHRLMRQNRRR